MDRGRSPSVGAKNKFIVEVRGSTILSREHKGATRDASMKKLTLLFPIHGL